MNRTKILVALLIGVAIGVLVLSFLSSARADDFNFIRGDCNQDKQVDISDPISIMSYLYNDWDSPCLAACDVQNDGFVEDADVVYLFNWLFSGGPPPVFPFPGCNEVETSLPCADDSVCP